MFTTTNSATTVGGGLLDSNQIRLLEEEDILINPPLSHPHPNNDNNVVAAAAAATAASVKKDIPIVIISSLRPSYLEMVVQAIEPSRQNINTPSWILNSTRYIFAHKNQKTNKKNRWNETQTIARQHGYHLEVFEGFDTGNGRQPQDPIRAYTTKHTWYRMMRYLFHTLGETEVLILEDDAVLAPDGLLMAAALLEERHRINSNSTNNQTDPTTLPIIHGIAMGGHAGANKVNANLNEYMAVRTRYFQAMAYSMSVDVFDILDTNFQKVQQAYQYMTPRQLEEENSIELADWTMEITERNLLGSTPLTQLHPSVGRMHHIGLKGMGGDGNGEKRKPYPIPWSNWNVTIRQQNRTMADLYLYPTQITDTQGFVCASGQPQWFCPNMPRKQQILKDEYGWNKVKYRFLQQWEEYLKKTTYIPGQPHPFFPNSMKQTSSQQQQQQTTTTTTKTDKDTTTANGPPESGGPNMGLRNRIKNRRQQTAVTATVTDTETTTTTNGPTTTTTTTTSNINNNNDDSDDAPPDVSGGGPNNMGRRNRIRTRHQEKFERQQKEERLQQAEGEEQHHHVVVTKHDIMNQHNELSTKLAAKLAAATNKFAPSSLPNNNKNNNNKDEAKEEA